MTTNKDIINNDKKDVELTEQNWLMYKHIQAGRTIKEAYELAGYKGSSIQAPYQVYNKMKKKLEMIWDSDNADSLRLKMEAKKIADMPVKEKEIKAETKLKAIETLHKLQGNDVKKEKSISPFIVFKAQDGKVEALEGKVIEADVVEKSDDNTEK